MEEIAPLVSPIPLVESTKPKIRKMAIIYAVLFDLLSTACLSYLMYLIYLVVITNGSFLYFSNLQQEIASNKLFDMFMFLLGSIVSIMAGYLCAQLGKHRPYAHALWAGFFTAALNLAALFDNFTLMLSKTIEVHFGDMFAIFFLPYALVLYFIGAHIYHLLHRI
ncbi:MAG TPA: hypothetical protein VJJ02_01265 [Candidatus Paceibacterota bacterium]